MFATVPVYNATNESEERLIAASHIEEVKPHADVPVDPGAIATPCCEVRFFSNTPIIVLLDMDSMKAHLQALTGVVDDFGSLL